MDPLVYSLRPLNWSMAMSGSQLFPFKYKFVNFLLKLHAIGLIITGGLRVRNVHNEIGIDSDSPLIIILMMHVWNLQLYFGNLAYIVVVWRINRQLKALLCELSEYLDRVDYSQIFRFSICIFINKIVYMVFVKFSFPVFFIWNQYSNGSQFKASHLLVLYVQSHDWFVSTLCLYVTLLKVIHLAEANIMKSLQNGIERTSPKVLFCKIRNVIEFKDNVSQQISFLVCLMFLNIFVASIGNICRFQLIYFKPTVAFSARLYSLLSLGRLGMRCLQLSFLVFMVHKWSRDSQKWLTSLWASIFLSHKKTTKWQPVLDEIKVAQGYKYRAFDFFDIDRNLLLSFIASSVPLTVLFIQLINQARQ